MIKIHAFLIPLILTRFILAQTFDYVVFENPSLLTIYNKYQQSLSEAEKDKLAPYTPFQIIEENEMLSDQITVGTRCLYDNNIYFILKNEENQYFENDEASYFEIFKNCELLGDTIQILKNRSLYTYLTPKEKNYKINPFELGKEKLWSREFKKGNSYYLKQIGEKKIFGWARLPSNNSWQIYFQLSYDTKNIPDKLVQRLQARIESANQSYINYFSFFNNKYGLGNTYPQWEIEFSESIIEGKLNANKFMEDLQMSNKYLFQDLENILLGSKFNIVFKDDRFIISSGIKR